MHWNVYANRTVEKEERIRCQRMTVLSSVSFLVAALMLQHFHIESYSVCISISVMLTAALQLPCVVRRV